MTPATAPLAPTMGIINVASLAVWVSAAMTPHTR